MIIKGIIAQFEAALSGELVTGLSRPPKKNVTNNIRHLTLIFFFFDEDQLVAVKNYAVHQSLEDPGSASQQSECNDPAPH